MDVAVVGGGSSGRAAAAAATASGQSVVVLDSADGVEVVAAYAGPLVVARTRDGMLQVQASEVVVATGAAEIHPVCPGNELAGLLTARAAAQLHAAGISVPGAVAIGTVPEGVPCSRLDGRLVRFEGGDGRVKQARPVNEPAHEHKRVCEQVEVSRQVPPHVEKWVQIRDGHREPK